MPAILEVKIYDMTAIKFDLKLSMTHLNTEINCVFSMHYTIIILCISDLNLLRTQLEPGNYDCFLKQEEHKGFYFSL